MSTCYWYSQGYVLFLTYLTLFFSGMNPKIIKCIEGKDAAVADEDVLYKQEFVANPEYTVGELVEKLNCEVQHFTRYECGEQS